MHGTWLGTPFRLPPIRGKGCAREGKLGWLAMDLVMEHGVLQPPPRPPPNPTMKIYYVNPIVKSSDLGEVPARAKGAFYCLSILHAISCEGAVVRRTCFYGIGLSENRIPFIGILIFV